MKNVISTTLALISLSPPAFAGLVVHEWGTFTSVVGSDGVPASGMFQEDEALPAFVHNFGDNLTHRTSPRAQQTAQSIRLAAAQFPTPAAGKPQADPRCPGAPKVPCDYLIGQPITQKMETPVVYFHADKPQNVTFDVSFPTGIISQSYPAPDVSYPEPVPGVPLRNGSARYNVEVLKDQNVTIPEVPAGNIYGHARNVKSDFIRVGSEAEKFIFYRGLADFRSQISVTSTATSLKIRNNSALTIASIYLVGNKSSSGNKAEAKGAWLKIPALVPGEAVTLNMAQLEPLRSPTQSLSRMIRDFTPQLKSALEATGLYGDEAQAMIDTWNHGYFHTPGLRLLYVLNRDEVEAMLPAVVTPKPDEFSRAFVGRVEILLAQEESAFLEAIQRQGVAFDVATLGRLAYPTLLRIREVARQRGVLTTELGAVFEGLLTKIP
jgi:hypothetical protein